MSEATDQIKCVLLAINEDSILLPNTALAEIIPIRNMINVANKPNWMLGYLDWRGQPVPLVSFEAIGGVRMPSLASGNVKAAVVYSIRSGSKFPFISFLVQGEPKVLSLHATDVIASKEPVEHPAIDQKVMVKEDMASIIDLEKLGQVIESVLT
ncbi:MAG: chemotaxis protein CheW [Gammaproteobacteria bacterium]|nr:chemotaxis protein CheW [Gammaproteobacteria bacterium]